MALFSLKVYSILLIIVIVVLVKEDIRNKGSFEESNTGIFLRDVGLYNHTLNCYSWCDDLLNQTKVTIRKNIPDYYDTTAEAVEPVVSTLIVYVNATVLSTKKWCYIITHERANSYFPIVKDNLLYYKDEFQNFIGACKICAIAYLNKASNIIWEKLKLIWDPVKIFIEDNFSFTIDLDHIYMEIKVVANTISQYMSDLYNKIIDLLNLERTI